MKRAVGTRIGLAILVCGLALREGRTRNRKLRRVQKMAAKPPRRRRRKRSKDGGGKYDRGQPGQPVVLGQDHFQTRYFSTPSLLPFSAPSSRRVSPPFLNPPQLSVLVLPSRQPPARTPGSPDRILVPTARFMILPASLEHSHAYELVTVCSALPKILRRFPTPVQARTLPPKLDRTQVDLLKCWTEH